MPKKSKGIATFPTGIRYPGDVNIGADQRPMAPGNVSGKGIQGYPTGHRLGQTDSDPQRAHNPPNLTGKGIQQHKSTRFGDTDNQNQDPSRPLNP